MDQYNDPCNIELVKMAEKRKLPNRVLQIDLNSKEIEKLASSKFALPEARLFPIHTPEETLLSTAFFIEKKASITKSAQKRIETRLEAASIAYDIVPEYMDLLREDSENSMYKEASAIEEYALDIRVNGERVTAFPIGSPEEVVKSAGHISNSLDKLSPDLAKEVCETLIKKADYYRVAIEDTKINSICEQRGVDIEKVAEYMIYRAKRASDPILKSAMFKSAQVMLTTPEHEIEFEKVAEFLNSFDSIAGTNRNVRNGWIPDGYQSVFNQDLILDKQAASAIKLAGKDYTPDTFEKLAVSKWAEALGQDFVDAATDGGEFRVAQAMDMASTLPLPDAKILSEYLDGAIEKSSQVPPEGYVRNVGGPMFRHKSTLPPRPSPEKAKAAKSKLDAVMQRKLAGG